MIKKIESLIKEANSFDPQDVLKIANSIRKGGDNMSSEIIRKIESLIEEGNSFDTTRLSDPSSFIKRTIFGKKYLLTTEYRRWKTEAENLIISQFGVDSSIYFSFSKGDGELEGYGSFKKGHGYIMGSLHAALNAVKLVTRTKKVETKTKKVPSRNKKEGREDETDTEKVSSKGNKEVKKDEAVPLEDGKKIFVVHGHDERLKNQLEIFLAEIGLRPVILHRKPDEGLTIVEKFEKHSDVGYAFILLTPDDISYSVSEENIPDEDRQKEMRARQNVIWEFGFFAGKLGRNRICCLYKEGVTLPTDISGMLYKEIRDNVEEAAFAIIKDLKAAGYDFQIS